MLNVKQLAKEVRKELIDSPDFIKKLLMSGALHRSLESKLWFANHSWGIPDVPVDICWGGGFIARTNNAKIQINAASDYLSEDDTLRYYELFGLAAHENAHRRYTNFEEMIKYAKDMEKGITPIPPGEPDDEKRMNELLNKAPKTLSIIVFKMHNAIEDGRIEDLFIKNDKNLLTLWEGLVKVRERTYSAHSPSYDEVMADELPDFLKIEQMLLTYGRFGRVEGLPDVGEIPETLKRVFPLVDAFKREADIQKRLSLLTEITMKLSRYIVDYLNEKNEALDDSFPEGSNTLDESGDSNDQDNQGGPGSSEKQNAPQGDNQSGTSESQSSGSGESNQQENGKNKLGGSFNDGSTSQEVQEDQDGMKGTTEMPELDTRGEEEFGKPTETPPGDESPNLDELKEQLIQEEVEKRAEEIVRQMMEELGSGKNNIERPDITEGDKGLYRKLLSELEPVIKKAIKLSTFKFEQDPYLAKRRYFGTRFDASKVASGDFKTFSKVIRPPEKSGLRVVLNVDESGSMDGPRILAARSAAIMVYEYCTRMEIPIDIMGFDTSIRNYVDSNYQTPKDGPRLTKISAMGGTVDDIPLMIAKEKLNKHPESKKLILVISDGCGREKKVKAIVKDCQRDNIAILAAALGEDKKTLEDLYGRESFMDIQDLSKLPQVLVKKIKNMLY